jgi:hypothetical protein
MRFVAAALLVILAGTHYVALRLEGGRVRDGTIH